MKSSQQWRLTYPCGPVGMPSLVPTKGKEKTSSWQNNQCNRRRQKPYGNRSASLNFDNPKNAIASSHMDMVQKIMEKWEENQRNFNGPKYDMVVQKEISDIQVLFDICSSIIHFNKIILG